MKKIWNLLLISLLANLASAEKSKKVALSPADAPVILIGIDGVRWDTLRRVDLPVLARIAANGTQAEGLIPQFPSFSYVNFYTIVTGLYPENHGIVHNAIYDPLLREAFKHGINQSALFDPTKKDLAGGSSFRDPRWWGGEPIWVTAEKNGVKTATFFWVGSEAKIKGVQPAYVVPFDPRIPHDERIQQVIEWLALPPAERPQLITLYFDEVDLATHIFGVGSEQEQAALRRIDDTLGLLLEALAAQGVRESTNLVIVSDHGFLNLEPDHMIDLDELMPAGSAEVLEFSVYPASPVASFLPRALGVDELHALLKGAHPHLKVYRREEIPERFHNRENHRVPPLLGLADPGWVVASMELFKKRGDSRLLVGVHGYDPAVRDMHGIFLGQGPAFPAGKRVPAFENVHIYEMLARLLGIQPAENDGDPEVVAQVLGGSE